MKHPAEIIAHRGASHDAPENTLAAIRLGWAQQADAAEIDVYATRDGAVVAVHDPDLQRTTGYAAPVEATDFATLRALDAGSWKSAEFQGEKIPTLSEVIAIVPPDRRLYVELKGRAGLMPALRQALSGVSFVPEQVWFICFDAALLRETKAAWPQCRVLLLADGCDEGSRRQRTTTDLDPLIALCREAGFEGLDLGDNWPIDAALVDRVHRAGLKLAIWTVNDPARARQLAAAGVDAITTDRPGLIRDTLHGEEKG